MSNITVLTPAYNRGKLLEKLYESLCAQDCKDFEWLIVDDGSTDDTSERVEQMKQTADFPISYHIKENGGKHTALNYAYQFIKAPLTFIVDSDDSLTVDAISCVNEIYKKYKNESDLCGFSFLRGKPDGGYLSTSGVPQDGMKESYVECRINRNIGGDMYYILWQHWAWLWVKHSGIRFDVIHHVTMNDYRIPSELYKAKGAKVIWGPMGGAQVTPRPLKVYEKNQLVASFREFVNKSCSWNPFYKKALRSYYKIYCINNETQKQISCIVGKDVPLMPELALRDEYKNLPIRKGKNDILKIVFVGRLIGKKGIAFLVDALSLMPTDMDWELLIFGDGDDRALIEKQIADSCIGKNVKLMGNRPLNQIAEAYQQADVFVLPSLRETSGNVLLEAMAYAVPIVAFDTSFCRLLKEVDCGVFINTEQALDNIKEDYCKAIVTLGQDKELAKQMGLNGYKYVNSKLTWDEKYRIIVNDM